MEVIAGLFCIAAVFGLIFLVMFLITGLPEIAYQKRQEKKMQKEQEKTKQIMYKPHIRWYVIAYLSKAKSIAEGKGLMRFCEKHESDIEKMVMIHAGKSEIIEAEIYYFVYGIHDQIEQELSDDYEGELLGNVEFLVKVHMPIINIITETPPKDMKPQTYVEFIGELYSAMDDDAEFLAVYDKYGYEYPERIKKLLANDIDTLVEAAFYSVAMTIQSSNAKYLNKGFANLNFILYYCANYHDVLFSEDTGEKQKEHYESLLKMHFCEYAEMMKIIKDKDKAEVFFTSRYGKYKSIDISDDDTNLETIREVADYTKITQYLNENAKTDILVEMSELMTLLNESAKPYFEKMAEEFERQEIIRGLEGLQQMVDEEIENRTDLDEED